MILNFLLKKSANGNAICNVLKKSGFAKYYAYFENENKPYAIISKT